MVDGVPEFDAAVGEVLDDERRVEPSLGGRRRLKLGEEVRGLHAKRT